MNHPRMLLRAARNLGLAGGLSLSGCSTLAEKAGTAECFEDTPCEDGFVCDLGLCKQINSAPLAYIGFDLQEFAGMPGADVTVEMTGCDREVDQVPTEGLVTLTRSVVTQTFALQVLGRPVPEGVEPEPEDLLPATFSLSQVSRLSRGGQVSGAPFPPPDSEEVSTQIRWPRYHPADALPQELGGNGYVLWTIEPTAETDEIPQALLYHVLTPPLALSDAAPCTQDIDCCAPGDDTCDGKTMLSVCVRDQGICRIPFNPTAIYAGVLYEDACDRRIDGQVRRVNDELNQLGAVPGANVTIRYANALPVPGNTQESRLGLAPLYAVGTPCSSDSECISGSQFCNQDTQICEVALAGRTAWEGNSFLDDPKAKAIAGDLKAQVYTYCDPTSTSPLLRRVSITATPPEEMGLPTVRYEGEVLFQPGTLQTVDPTLTLCIPDWGDPVDVGLKVSGDPVVLLRGDGTTYTCCSSECLPRTAQDVAAPPPTAQAEPGSCSGQAQGVSPGIVAVTDLVAGEAWDAATKTASACFPPTRAGTDTDVAGRVIGELHREASCGEDDNGVYACTLRALAGNATQPRSYRVRIETPTGSVLRSVITSMEVGTEPKQGAPEDGLVPFVLGPRTIVRGRVLLPESRCGGNASCGSEGAKVLAERLRIGNETTDNTAGPYFHEVLTHYDPDQAEGSYVLPLDPGVWVLTALPSPGQVGGPAPYVVLDLRETDGSVPVQQDFVLREGTVVRLAVKTEQRTQLQLVPLDMGSWTADPPLQYPAGVALDSAIDLSAPGECLTAPGDIGPKGCRIRRLISGGSLPPTQVGEFRFTTRDPGGSGGTSCFAE